LSFGLKELVLRELLLFIFYLKEGQIVECEIEKIGILSNPVTREVWSFKKVSTGKSSQRGSLGRKKSSP
jgi:hypothetical protein